MPAPVKVRARARWPNKKKATGVRLWKRLLVNRNENGYGKSAQPGDKKGKTKKFKKKERKHIPHGL